MGQETINVLAIVFGAGGFISAIVSWKKAKPETDRITVSSAEGAVLVQAGVIQTLREEIERLEEVITACNAAAKELRDLVDLVTERKKLRRAEDQEMRTLREAEDSASRQQQIDVMDREHPPEE